MALAVKVSTTTEAQAVARSESKAESRSKVEQDWLNDLIVAILDQLPIPEYLG